MSNFEMTARTPGELLTPDQTAKRTGLSAATLANMRCTGRGPVFHKIAKYVRYDSNDVDAWMRSRRYTSTSQESAA